MSSSLSSKRKKKAAPSAAASSLRVHVRVASPSSRDSDPIVCSFPGGFPQSLQPKFTWHGNRVVGQDAACYYFASSSEPKDEGSAPPATKLCVGVYDKHTGQLTLHPAADNGRVFCLQQRVAQYQSNSRNNGSNHSSEIRGAAAQYRALFEDFGSAKKRKVLRSQRANQVEAVVGLGVTSSQPGATMSESNRQALAKQRAALAAAQAAAGDESGNDNSNNRPIRLLAPSDGVDAAMAEMRQRFLPKFNAAAKHPGDVYDAEDMASHEGWAHVSRVVTACWHKADVVQALTQPRPNQHFNNDTPHTKPTTEHDTWNASVKMLLYKIPDDCQSFSEEQASIVKRKLKCALVLNHWIHLWNRLHRKRFIPAPDDTRHFYFGQPRALAVRFLERFGTPTVDEQSGQAGYAFSQANRDSCHVHLFLLYMMADYHDGSSSSSATTALWADNIQPLANDLHVDAADAIKLLRQAGCTVQRGGGGGGGKSDNNNKITVVLKTPLTFPKTQKSAAARR